MGIVRGVYNPGVENFIHITRRDDAGAPQVITATKGYVPRRSSDTGGIPALSNDGIDGLIRFEADEPTQSGSQAGFFSQLRDFLFD